MISMPCLAVARRLLAVVFLLGIQGCGSPSSPDEDDREIGPPTASARTEMKVDSWYHRTPTPQIPSGQLGGVMKLSQKEIYEVSEASEAQAEAMLLKLSIIPLSFGQASKFTEGKFQGAATTSPYLVRALYLNQATGSYLVSQSNNQLFVEHGSLGHSEVPMKRSTLVVQLRSLPAEVFVSCGMAE